MLSLQVIPFHLSLIVRGHDHLEFTNHDIKLDYEDVRRNCKVTDRMLRALRFSKTDREFKARLS